MIKDLNKNSFKVTDRLKKNAAKNDQCLTPLLVVLPPDCWCAGVIAAFTQAGQTQ